MCDVVFITPNISADTKSECLGSLQLATILNQQGISCDILQYFRIGDVRKFDEFMENALSEIEKRQPKIVSFYARCDIYHISLRMAELVKARWSNIYIVFGGPQSDITSVETITEIPWVDYVCCGEGENTVYPFFSSLLRGEPDLSVPGLVYRQGDQIIKNPRPQLIDDLDSLPMVDYSLLHFGTSAIEAKKIFTIDVGRGCPFSCTFCSTNTFWGRKFRLKSPQRIYEEIKFLHEHYGRERFSFAHDMFTFNRKKVLETCALLKTLDFPIQWGCCARLDCIDKELIDIMADAGMVGVYLGIETGSPRMQKLIRKNLKTDNAVEICSYLKSKGMTATASFIFGFPEETEEDVSYTLSLIGKLISLGNVSVQTHLCTFHMGTELSSRYATEMTPVNYYSDQTGEMGMEECKDLILAHPSIFQHLFEYKTELRTKLRYFPEFVQLWNYMYPVYRYLSEKYPENNMIQLYYDFVDANREVLERLDEAPKNLAGYWLGRHDRLPERFADDENYDLIQDVYRYRNLSHSKLVQTGGCVSDVFCFDPRQIKQVPLQEYTRCLASVTWKDKKGHISIEPLEG